MYCGIVAYNNFYQFIIKKSYKNRLFTALKTGLAGAI